METLYDTIVIGAGIAGLSASKAFAEARSGSSILLINGEDRLPYKRTKISKNIAKGYETDEFCLTHPLDLANQSIQLVNRQVLNIDRAAKTVELSDGMVVGWKTLILAVGAIPKQIFTAKPALVRTAEDGEALCRSMRPASTVAVIGGGVLGVEVADQLVRAGRKVTLICRGDMMMPHELNRALSDRVEAAMTEAGIIYCYNVHVDDVIFTESGYQVRSNGEETLYDLVVECTGSDPDIRLAQRCGLETEIGVRVGPTLQSSDPAIFVAGDCTQLHDGAVAHLWHQAEDQGRCAGQNAAAFLDGNPLAVNPNRPRRLKCEVFGLFLFSINAHLRKTADSLQCYQGGDICQEFGFSGGRLISAIMMGDKARGKLYEKAVWEGLSPEEVERDLSV